MTVLVITDRRTGREAGWVWSDADGCWLRFPLEGK